MTAASGRRPVRAAVAFAGAGSLGTFLVGAARRLLLEIRAHNRALLDDAPPGDPRYLHPQWGRITVDAVAGSSAGALCGAQFIKALFEPDYLGGDSNPADPRSMTGAWVTGGDFATLTSESSGPSDAGRVVAAAWTLLSGTKLSALAERALAARGASSDPESPLEESGIVAFGVTLTDLLGSHEHAEFEAHRVLGHPECGCQPPRPSPRRHGQGRPMRDLGGRSHGEVRKFLIARDAAGQSAAQRYLDARGAPADATATCWGSETGIALAAASAGSAALPLAVGPVGLRDLWDGRGSRRLYMDGGVLNNKPVAPALRLARWQDGVRLASTPQQADGTWSLPAVDEALGYTRLVFFLDAFPETDVQRSDADTAAWEVTVDRCLRTPTAALPLFAHAILSSLRAQDMREIAKTNHWLAERRQFIAERLASPPAAAVAFPVDSLARAQAIAAVRDVDGAAAARDEVVRAIAQRVWEADRFSGLAGRREVTMVPIFSPSNRAAVFAGDRLYAVGGLLGLPARLHDCEMGHRVAGAVVQALRGVPSPLLSHGVRTPEPHALPDDAAPLAERARLALMAGLDALFENHPTVGWFAKLPLHVAPLVDIAKQSLDRHVGGTEPGERAGRR